MKLTYVFLIALFSCGPEMGTEFGSSKSAPVAIKETTDEQKPQGDDAKKIQVTISKTATPEPLTETPIPETKVEEDVLVSVNKLCASKETKKIQTKITFDGSPKGTVCPWGVENNLPTPTNGTITARLEEVYDLDLPQGSILCSMNFWSKEDAFVYDDEIYLTLNDIILVASSSHHLNEFENRRDFLAYDWNKIVGRTYTTGDGAYCAGGENTCTVPPTEKKGKFRFEMPDAKVQALGVAAGVKESRTMVSLEEFQSSNKQSALTFKLITTGDNDKKIDCMHSQINLDVDLTYVFPK